jgi:hypothetical protein
MRHAGTRRSKEMHAHFSDAETEHKKHLGRKRCIRGCNGKLGYTGLADVQDHFKKNASRHYW